MGCGTVDVSSGIRKLAIRPGTHALGSPQLLHARAGVRVTKRIPAPRLSAGQDGSSPMCF
jgi:hypothetical protein